MAINAMSAIAPSNNGSPTSRTNETSGVGESSSSVKNAGPSELIPGLESKTSLDVEGDLSKVVIEERQATEKSTVDQSTIIHSCSTVRVLLVNDERPNRSIGFLLLEQLGFQVEVASDSATALNQCDQTDFDFVLVDFDTPGIDGCETIHRLRLLQESRKRLVPIVGLISIMPTGNCWQGSRIDRDELLLKPLQANDLLQAIKQWANIHDQPDSKNHNPWSLDVEDIRTAYPMTSNAMGLVVKFFRESCVEKLDRIQDAFDRHDSETISRNLHALKGSLAMFASSRTLEIVRKLEVFARTQELDRAKGLLPMLEHAIDQLQPTLDLLSLNSQVTNPLDSPSKNLTETEPGFDSSYKSERQVFQSE